MCFIHLSVEVIGLWRFAQSLQLLGHHLLIIILALILTLGEGGVDYGQR